MRNFAFAAALIGGMVTAGSASALPMSNPLGAEAGQSRATDVAWYCNNRGHCVKAKRFGYSVRPGWVPSCGRGYWGGYRCVYPRSKVIIRGHGPDIKIKRNHNGAKIKIKP